MLSQSYLGMTTVTGAFARMHGGNGHMSGKGGAKMFSRWLTSLVIANYFDFFHRLLANPADPRESMQLEILGGQLACVGYGCGLSLIHI